MTTTPTGGAQVLTYRRPELMRVQLGIYTVFCVGYAWFLAALPDRLISGPSYRLLFDVLPRQAYAVPWSAVGVVGVLALYRNTPGLRRAFSALMLGMSALWGAGLTAAVFVHPHNGSLTPLLTYGVYVASWIAYAHLPTDDPSWGPPPRKGTGGE